MNTISNSNVILSSSITSSILNFYRIVRMSQKEIYFIKMKN